jgi:hypothetical protein
MACAIAGECTYFVTSDDDVLKRRQDVHDIMVIDPTALVREMNLRAPIPKSVYAAFVPWLRRWAPWRPSALSR